MVASRNPAIRSNVSASPLAEFADARPPQELSPVYRGRSLRAASDPHAARSRTTERVPHTSAEKRPLDEAGRSSGPPQRCPDSGRRADRIDAWVSTDSLTSPKAAGPTASSCAAAPGRCRSVSKSVARISASATTIPARPRSTDRACRIIENGRPVLAKDIIVNDPLHYQGINIFQSSYGTLPPSGVRAELHPPKGSGEAVRHRAMQIGQSVRIARRPGPVLPLGSIAPHTATRAATWAKRFSGALTTPTGAEPAEVTASDCAFRASTRCARTNG
ncbi:MAG: cytochrome c biogenesis protein ResB [Desulfobacterales bacterium]|nr:cytochrome c biogenesis protein ResB [Desulfobacterales bacterium]